MIHTRIVDALLKSIRTYTQSLTDGYIGPKAALAYNWINERRVVVDGYGLSIQTKLFTVTIKDDTCAF